MAALTWRDVSTGIDPNESLLGVGAGMISKGLEAPAGIIGKVGDMLKGQEVRQKDLMANDYIMQQQDAEEELKTFLSMQQGNPFLSTNIIDSKTGKLAFVDKNSYLEGQAKLLGMDLGKMDNASRNAFLGEASKKYDEASEKKNALERDYEAIRSGLDNSRTIQKTLRGMYSQDSQWLSPDEVNAKTTALSSLFGGAVDTSAIAEEKAVTEKILDNDLAFQVQDLTMKQEAIKNRVQTETSDYSQLSNALKDKTHAQIVAELTKNAGTYADMADTVTKLALYNFQKNTRDWEDGKAQELGNMAAAALSDLTREQDAIINSNASDADKQAARERKTVLENQGKVIWLQTISEEPVEENTINSGMDIEKGFYGLGGFGEDMDKAKEYFKEKMKPKLLNITDNQKHREKLILDAQALEEDKKLAREARLYKQSQVDAKARSDALARDFRNLVAPRK